MAGVGEPKDQVPWKRMRYLTIFLVTFGVAAAFATRISLSIALVAMTDPTTNPDFPTYDWDVATQSTLLSSFFWGYVVSNVPAGILMQKYGPRWLLIGGHMSSALASFLVPIAADSGGWGGVCALRVIQGFSQGAIFPSISALLAKWALPSEIGQLGSICFSGMQAGNFIALPLSGALASSSGGWPSIFYLFGGVSVAWAVLWFFFGYNCPGDNPHITEKEKKYIESYYRHTPSTTSFKTPFKSIVLSIPMWALLISHSVQNWCYYMLLTEMPLYMSNILKFDIRSNGLLASLPYIVMFVVVYLYGWAADMIIKRKILTLAWTRKLFNTIGFAGPMATMIGLSYIGLGEKDLAVALLVLSCGLNAGVYLGFQVNHVELAPNFAGVLMAMTNTISSVMSLLVPLVVGAIVTDQKDEEQWHIVFWMSAAAYLIGCLAYFFFSSNSVQTWNVLEQIEIQRGDETNQDKVEGKQPIEEEEEEEETD